MAYEKHYIHASHQTTTGIKGIVITINAGPSYGLDSNKDSKERGSLLHLQLSFTSLVWGVDVYENHVTIIFPIIKTTKYYHSKWQGQMD